MPARKKRSNQKKTRRGSGRGGAARRWWLALAGVMLIVVAGVGMLGWARTDPGRARLLRLGVDRYRVPVQAALDTAVAGVFEDYRPGPVATDLAAADPVAHDWPLSDAGTGAGPDAAIRCRIAVAPEGLSLWETQAVVAEALVSVGGEVLWGERLRRPSGRWSGRTPGKDGGELLRLDLGVAGAATHTLVIHPAGSRAPDLRWGVDTVAESVTDWLGPLEIPTIAVVIDDWGYTQNETTRGLLKLDLPLTLSILPGLPHSRHYALKATELALPEAVGAVQGGSPTAATMARRERGCPVTLSLGSGRGGEPPRKRREIMLHLPMEPQGYPEINPGETFLSVGISREDIAAQVDEALNALPGVTGVNNHMGSAATADVATMERLMQVLEKRGLFFLDSMTTSRSVAVESARREGVPVLSSRLFLDQAVRDRDQVSHLLGRLVSAARATGAAVGICHPYPETLAVLAEALPRYRDQGIRFVTASELLALQRERRLAEGAPR